jgi:glycosyltransferase involved in cell wall biosynthesis
VTAIPPRPALAILGIRGIPAAHGGFETFAERLAPELVRRGWDVVVYCQDDAGQGGPAAWNGVTLRHIRPRGRGSLGSVSFDLACLRDLRQEKRRLLLVLGYNTACLGVLPWLRGQRQLINMDGIEWRRPKWSWPIRLWFYGNERLACWLASELIADHPVIADHLATRTARRRIATIPYGADRVDTADPGALARFGVAPRGYALAIARPEPENGVLEIVRAFAARPRGLRLIVLGGLREGRPYDDAVRAAAGAETVLPGAIYEADIVRALRVFARLHLHGHRVGGTNPSLVEALGCGSPVLAQDNPFNRWVAGPGAAYYRDAADCADWLDRLLGDDERLDAMRRASLARHAEAFTWPAVLDAYEARLRRWAEADTPGRMN